MSFRAVTFDCAETLLGVDWRPAPLAVGCLDALGLAHDPVTAEAAYDAILRSRYPEFRELNRTRDEKTVDCFWRNLTEDWLEQIGLSQELAPAVGAEADRRIFGPETQVFELFDDVRPCLDRLRRDGYRLAVVSNWDISLHRSLREFGLYDYFDVVVASMEEGVEKPDPALFEVALGRMKVSADETLHVGDNPLDDLIGAKRAGMRCLLIDRSQPCSSKTVLNTLADLPEAMRR